MTGPSPVSLELRNTAGKNTSKPKVFDPKRAAPIEVVDVFVITHDNSYWLIIPHTNSYYIIQ